MHAYTGKEIAAGGWKGNGQNAPAPSSAQAAQTAPAAAPLDASMYQPQGAWQGLNETHYTTTYPGNWQSTKGTTSAVTVAPAGGVVNTSGSNNSAVAYGVIIDTLQMPQNANAEDPTVLSQATQQLLASLKQENGLTALGGEQDVRVNGQAGKSQDFQGKSPVRRNGVPEREHDWVVTISRPDGNLNYLVFVAPERDFASLKPVYVEMLRQFRVK